MDILMRYKDLQIMFEYNGVCEYSPNDSSMCGYGSDEWFFLCKSGRQNCILRFSYSGEYGAACWSCCPVPESEIPGTVSSGGNGLKKIFYDHFIFSAGLPMIHLHPVDIQVVKSIIQPSFHRNGPLTDNDYIGI